MLDSRPYFSMHLGELNATAFQLLVTLYNLIKAT